MCGGAAGIGTALIRMGTALGVERYTRLTEQCAKTVVHYGWAGPTSMCCGLAGCGKFLLDMADHTGDSRYMQWANEIASVLVLRRDHSAAAHGPLADRTELEYGKGRLGELDFLLRLRSEGTKTT
jgi:lantibiotic modifying enzyme